jgi:hypothetical protein
MQSSRPSNIPTETSNKPADTAHQPTRLTKKKLFTISNMENLCIVLWDALITTINEKKGKKKEKKEKKKKTRRKNTWISEKNTMED